MKYIILALTIAFFNMNVFIIYGCIHDNKIMQEKIERMEKRQLEQAQKIRQIQTDTDAALKIIINGDMEGKK